MYILEAEDILNYKCPRWEQLPNLGLYIDQVVTILEDNLALFEKDKSSPFITPSMINNYVKNKIIKPPFKKKYDRDQLAHLFVICILKKVINLTDTAEAIRLMKKLYSVQDGYNIFCNEIETALKETFSQESIKNIDNTETRELATLKTIATTFANSIKVDRLLLLRENK